MKKPIIILGVLLVILTVLISINKYVQSKGGLEKKVNVNSAVDDILSDEEKIKNISTDKGKQNTQLIKLSNQVATNNQDPKYVLKYVFASALTSQPDLFSSAFDVDQFNKDLFRRTNSDKVSVIKEMMKKITRINKLKYLKVINIKPDKTRSYYIVSARLFYQDNYQSPIVLKMKYEQNEERRQSILVITTSVWDLIKQIEKA